jgi:uncharacterized protein with HEPN domain
MSWAKWPHVHWGEMRRIRRWVTKEVWRVLLATVMRRTLNCLKQLSEWRWRLILKLVGACSM